MKNLLKRFFPKRMPEADLNSESVKASTYYLKVKFPGLQVGERQTLLNYVAHGFAMGVRWKEDQIGARHGKY
jgi:hypothetical protein